VANPLIKLQGHARSIRYDDIRHGLITSEDTGDLPIRGINTPLEFSSAFRPGGDSDVFAQRKRRLPLVHLGPDVRTAWAALRGMIEDALP